MIKPALSLLLASVLLASCGVGGMDDLHDFVKNAGSDMRGKVEPPPEIKPYAPFTYDNATNLPDPFKPRKPELRSGVVPGLNQPDLNRRRETLEEYPLDSLKMVGFMYQGNAGQAVIRTPEGKLNRVKVGNYIGQNFGKIIEITETEVKIKEMVQDSGGDWSERMSSLQLVE